MDEKLKKAILENEELLEMLLAIHFNNKSTEDGKPKLTYYETDGDLSQPFKDASYYDIEYNKMIKRSVEYDILDSLRDTLSSVIL